MRVKEYILVAMCGVALSAGAANAQVIIHTGPPPPVIVERPGPPLHAGWVWVGGYYRWNGGRYVWVPGPLGQTHPGGELCGFPAAGSLVAGAMSGSPDPGVSAYRPSCFQTLQ